MRQTSADGAGEIPATKVQMLSEEEKRRLLKRHFPSRRDGPKKRDQPGVFEIALVLPGGVSAGAYTAGAMDYLIEALDEWNLKKAKDRANGLAFTPNQTVPHHEVILRIMTGASAGGRNGAIAAAMLNYRFPHIYDERKFAELRKKFPELHLGQEQDCAKNLFFRIWVVGADIDSMLDPADLKKRGALMSVLNESSQEVMTEWVEKYEGDPVPPGMRDWLANPYQLRLTTANLRGVPYSYSLQGQSPQAHQGFLSHTDQVAFAVEAPSAQQAEEPPPDCIFLPKSKTNKNWQTLGQAGLQPVPVRLRFAHATSRKIATIISGATRTLTWMRISPSSWSRRGSTTHQPRRALMPRRTAEW